MKKLFTLLCSLLCFAILAVGCNLDDGRGYSMLAVDEILSEYTSAANTDLINTGIDPFDEDGNKIEHTVEEYKKLYYLSEDTLIGYYRMLHEDKDETEKLVCALGYESWEDFLTQKGHLNDEGEPDIKVWRESEYVRLQKEHDERFGQETKKGEGDNKYAF